MFPRWVLVLATVVALVGCDVDQIRERLIPAEEVEYAKTYLAHFAKQDYDAIEAPLDPSLLGPSLRPELEHIASFFPAEAPVAVRLMGSNTHVMGDVSQFNLTFEYEYPETWLVANVVLRKSEGGVQVIGVTVYPVTESVRETNKFTFEDAGVVHFAMLAAAVAVPIFMLVTLVVAIRTPIAKRKWLWILFIIAGVMPTTLNWSTGELHMAFLSFQLLGAGFTKASEFAPLLLTVAVPLGAAIFWVKRSWGRRPQP